MEQKNVWKNCGSCKKAILLGQKYYSCSVSSCNKKSAPLIFCSVSCWDVHVPIMGHRSAWAEEAYAPTSPTKTPKLVSAAPTPRERGEEEEMEKDILIVASKLKAYVKERADLQTSANVMDRLSDLVREITDRAIERAKREGRKTLMDRDFISE